MHLLYCKIFVLKLSLLLIFFETKKYKLTRHVRIQLYRECLNSTLPSIVLESIWFYLNQNTGTQQRLLFCRRDEKMHKPVDSRWKTASLDKETFI